MQDRDCVRLGGEAALETLDRLRSKRNFRDEHDRRLAAGERGADRLEIDLRLAASGHAVEENGRVCFRIFERGFDQFQRGGLFFIQGKLRIGDELLRAMRIACHRLLAQARRSRA